MRIRTQIDSLRHRFLFSPFARLHEYDADGAHQHDPGRHFFGRCQFAIVSCCTANDCLPAAMRGKEQLEQPEGQWAESVVTPAFRSLLNGAEPQ